LTCMCFRTYDTLTSELRQHLQHMDTDLLRIVVQTGADDTKAVLCQYPAMQRVSLVLLVLLIFLIRYLLHGIQEVSGSIPLISTKRMRYIAEKP
jgi:hypothetical protein